MFPTPPRSARRRLRPYEVLKDPQFVVDTATLLVEDALAELLTYVEATYVHSEN